MSYFQSIIDLNVSASFGGFGDAFEVVNKFGRNPDTDMGSVPEDIWNGGGIYTGFPATTDELQVLSTSVSDTGVLTITYLADATSTEYVQADITLNGTTAVNTGITAYRVHTAKYASGTAEGFNQGTITCRFRNDNAIIFFRMPTGSSQTQVAAYTVPAGKTALVRRGWAQLSGNSGSTATCGVWVREGDVSPRYRRPFTVTVGVPYEDNIQGGILVNEGGNITIRMSSVSANNLELIGGFDIVLK